MSTRLQLKMLLTDIVNDSDRNQLLLTLATLLAFEAVIRAKIEASEPDDGSSSPQQTGASSSAARVRAGER